MATVNKDFRVKNGLVVEGTTATVNGSNVLTEASSTFLNNLIQDQAGSLLENATLTNIAITYNDETNALVITAENGVSDATTDDLVEGTTNLYFTDERAQDAFGILVANGTYTGATVTYNDGNNYFDITVTDQFLSHDTDDLTEGTTNLYFTQQRARDSVSGGNGITYDSGTGSFSIDDSVVATDTDVSDAVSAHSDLATGVHGVTGDVVGTDDVQVISNKTLGSDLNADTNKVTNLGAPTQANDAATKAYVDATAEGLHVKAAVHAATTTNLSGTYSNGTNGVDATLNLGPLATFEIDGVSNWSQEDGVLVKDQTNPIENGRYFVSQVGDIDTDWILKRCVNCDEPDEIPSAYVFVQAGTLYGGTGLLAQVENPTSFQVGVDDIIWVQFSGAGTYLAGEGLLLNGTEFSIDTNVTANLTSEQTLINKTIDGDDNTITNIANASLVNDSITVNSYEVELGSALTLSTDDIDEGQGATNLYYTNERVADLLRNANLTNIQITGGGVGETLSITAENGVDDATTDDLNEGTTNLYFTDQRAVDALAGENVSLTSVAFDTVAKTFAVSGNIANADTSTQAYTFAKASYRSAKLTVKFAYSTHTEISEVLLTMDTADNIAITEYAIVQTNGSLGTVTAALDGDNVDINVTVPNAGTVATIFGTLIA